jgi:hypothetical protein
MQVGRKDYLLVFICVSFSFIVGRGKGRYLPHDPTATAAGGTLVQPEGQCRIEVGKGLNFGCAFASRTLAVGVLKL